MWTLLTSSSWERAACLNVHRPRGPEYSLQRQTAKQVLFLPARHWHPNCFPMWTNSIIKYEDIKQWNWAMTRQLLKLNIRGGNSNQIRSKVLTNTENQGCGRSWKAVDPWCFSTYRSKMRGLRYLTSWIQSLMMTDNCIDICLWVWDSAVLWYPHGIYYAISKTSFRVKCH